MKIGPLTNLQDARSSAAVGFDVVTFSLERGSNQKLSGSMIWSIIQWLSGPAIALEINRFSLEELKEIEGVFDYDYLSIPLEEWGEDLLQFPGKLILRADATANPDGMASIIAAAPEGKVFVELSMEKEEVLQGFEAILPLCFLHQKSGGTHPPQLPGNFFVYGLSMKNEMEEEPGVLDYEGIDTWLEAFQEIFEEA